MPVSLLCGLGSAARLPFFIMCARQMRTRRKMIVSFSKNAHFHAEKILYLRQEVVYIRDWWRARAGVMP
jgi:glutamate-1-semialdehyde aminotransferase